MAWPSSVQLKSQIEPTGRRPPLPGLGAPLEHIYMPSRLAAYRPVPGSFRNRYRHLRRDHGGDILAGVPGPCALRIKRTRVNTIPVQIHVSEE